MPKVLLKGHAMGDFCKTIKKYYIKHKMKTARQCIRKLGDGLFLFPYPEEYQEISKF